jgi:hypothetical protein
MTARLRLLLCLLILTGPLGACETDPSQNANDGSAAQTPAPTPTIRLNDDPAQDGYGTIDVLGLETRALARLRDAPFTRADWTALLAIYTGEALPADPTATPPMLGAYTIQATGLRFTPRFPLVAGLAYTARFDPALLRHDEAAPTPEPLVATFALPRETTDPSTVVTRVYPTADVLPMNQLKMYLHFSAPMRRGEAYDHIRLFDADTGEPVEDPFVVIDQELWDAARTRFTLLFDPGRIKQDLRPHLEQGVPLQDGKRYRLLIAASWRDAAGNPLVDPFEKAFSVTAADRTSPDYEAWVLTPPQAGTTDPLTLTFDEPLEHALLHRLLVVRDADGAPVDGRIDIEQAETQWSLTPHHAWRTGAYVIEVDAVLEDLAGNNLRHVFDVDLNTQTPDRAQEDVPVRLPFEVNTD